MERQDNVDPVRYSHAGHDYHFTWASLKCMELLAPGSDLKAVAIEGASPEDNTADDEASLLIIDTACYYGSEDPSSARLIEYIQLKYSTDPKNREWTAAALSQVKKKGGSPHGVIGRFSDRFRAFYTKAPRPASCDGLRLRLITNVSISPIAMEAIDHLRRGSEPPADTDLEAAFRRLKLATGLDGEELQIFAKALSLEGQSNSRLELERQLEAGSTTYTAGPDFRHAANIKRAIRDRAQPEYAGDPCVRRETMLGALGLSSPSEFLPCPPQFDEIANPIERDCESQIARAIQENATAHTIVAAEGGVGKSVLARSLGQHFPHGSHAIVFDGFGGGSFRDPSQPRHTHDRAIVQIINDLSSRGLCWPLIRDRAWGRQDYLSTLRERLSQAVQRARISAASALVVVIIDAADNLAMAASDEADPHGSFANDLLKMLPIEGVRFVALCRPERQYLLGSALGVRTLSIPTFSLEETAVHVGGRFRAVGPGPISEFHRLTSANPRVQANELAEPAVEFQEVLSRLGPNPKSVDDVIEQQLDRKITSIQRTHSGERIELFCTALAVLPPRVPNRVLSKASGISEAEVNSFAADFGRALWLHQAAVQFRDEPTEKWFRDRFGRNDNLIADLCSALQTHLPQDPYSQSALPHLLVRSRQFRAAIKLALTTADLEPLDAVSRQRVQMTRVRYGLKASLQERDFGAIATCLLLLGEYASHGDRWKKFVSDHAMIFGRLQDPLLVQEYVFARRPSEWRGRAQGQAAAILSMNPEYHSDALAFLRQSESWLEEIRRSSKEEREKINIEDVDVLNRACAILHIAGERAAVHELTRWRPVQVGYRIARSLGTWLQDDQQAQRIPSLFEMARAAPCIALGLCEATSAFEVPLKARDLKIAAKSVVKKLKVPDERMPEWLGVVALAEQLAFAGCKSEAEALLRKYTPKMPGYIPGEPLPRECDQRQLHLRYEALIAVLEGRPFDLQKYRDALTKRYDKPAEYDNERTRAFNSNFAVLAPYYELRAKTLCRELKDEEVSAAWDTLASTQLSYEVTARHDWNLRGVRQHLAELRVELLLQTNLDANSHFGKCIGFLRERESGLLMAETVAVIRVARRSQRLYDECLKLASDARNQIASARSDAAYTAQLYVDLARALQYLSRDEAAYNLGLAIDCLKGAGEEIRYRLNTLIGLVGSAKIDRDEAETAYRLARVIEVVHDYESHKFPWEAMATALARLSPASALAIASRWRDRNRVSLDYTLPELIGFLYREDLISPSCAAALHPMAEGLPYEERDAYLSSVLARLPGRSTQLSFAADLIRDCNFDWHRSSASAAIARAIDGSGISAATVSPLSNPQINNLVPETNLQGVQIDWSKIFKCPIQSVDDFLVSFERFQEAMVFDGRDQFFIEAIRRVQPDRRRIFLEGLPFASAIRTYELVDLVAEARKQWSFSPPLLSLVPEIIKSYADRHAAEILFDGQKYSVAYDVGRLMNIDRCAASDVFSTFIANASDSLDSIEADTAFALVNLACRLISGEAARSVFEFALERFERTLKPEDGDGPWGSHLAPPAKPPDAIAGLVVSALASPETATRWRAAHTVVRLIRYGDIDVARSIAVRVTAGDPGPFVDAGLPFYAEHARLWLCIALARAALEAPEALAKLQSELIQLAESSTPHLLIKLFLRDAFQRLAASSSSLKAREVAQRLNAGVQSPFPIQPYDEQERRDRRTRRSRLTGEREDGFHFAMDFDRYWLERPAEAFGMTVPAFVEQARNWVAKLTDIDCAEAWKWDADPRGKRRLYRERSTYHSHGEYPDTENLGFYVSYHAMFITLGELLAAKPLQESTFRERDPLQDLLKSHVLTRVDGYWLSDRRDTAPAGANAEIVHADHEGWEYAVTRADLEKELYDRRYPGHLVVWAQRETGTNYRREIVNVRSALVKPGRSDALLRTFQSMPDFWRLPSAGSRDIRHGHFSLVGWIGSEESSRGIDEKDPYSGRIPASTLRFGATITRLMGLSSRNLDREWYAANEGSSAEAVAISEVWGDWKADRHGEAAPHGQGLYVKLKFLSKLLRKAKRELILEVQIERKTRKEKNYDLEKPYYLLFVLSQDGTLRTLRSSSQVGAAAGQGA